jgi:hypothetical protein
MAHNRIGTFKEAEKKLNAQLNPANPVDDPVNHPAHYTQGAVECIDAIRAALGRDGFIAFLRGQVIKYQWRLGLKGVAAEDAAKANWYGQKLEQVLKEDPLVLVD